MKLTKCCLFGFVLLIGLDLLLIGCSRTTRESKGLPTLEQIEAGREGISKYDPLMRQIGSTQGVDWRWIAAIAYQESRFSPTAQSSRGAMGLMQIRGQVARTFGYAPEQMTDPHDNILVGVLLLKRIESMLRFGPDTPQHDRMKILLACYNGGIGHVMDARRLAAKHGVNHNSWEALREYVLTKGSDRWVDDEAVRCGAFSGRETVAFVDNVMKQYLRYCEKYV